MDHAFVIFLAAGWGEPEAVWPSPSVIWTRTGSMVTSSDIGEGFPCPGPVGQMVMPPSSHAVAFVTRSPLLPGHGRWVGRGSL